MTSLHDVWVYLAASPLLHLTSTLVAWQIGLFIHRRFGSNPLLSPVAIAVALLAALLIATGTSYESYFQGAQFVHFLLGPATVALAIPLYRQLSRLKRNWRAVIASLLLGSGAAALSAVAIAALLGAPSEIVASLAPKSVTAPVAMAIAQKIGGLATLTPVLVLTTGIFGAMIGPSVLRLLRVSDPAARGLALGVASHGFGTARALQDGEVAGAFAGLGMALNALASSILIPVAWSLL